MKEEYIKVGKLGKVHGVNGALKCKADAAFEEIFDTCKVFFVEIKGQKIPYFLDKMKWGGNILIFFEDVKDREAAFPLSGCLLYVRTADIPKNLIDQSNTSSLKYASLKGFEIIDDELGSVGKIERIEDLPQQEMAVLIIKGKTVLIPLVEAFILDIDLEQQKVIMTLPEGLLPE